MMDFTKIKWAGCDCILITTTQFRDPKIPVAILTRGDIEELLIEWRRK